MQDHDALQERDVLNPEAAELGRPQVFEGIPIGLREVVGVPTLARFDHCHAVTLLGQPHRAHAAPEAAADDDEVEYRFSC